MWRDDSEDYVFTQPLRDTRGTAGKNGELPFS